MTLSMHSASVPVFSRTLRNMLVWLDKAEAHATARKFDTKNYLGLRLAPDMHPFSRQIQIATDSAKNCVARLAGLEPPKWADDEASFKELRERIQKAIDYVESIPAQKIDGSEAREIVMPAGPDRTFTLAGEAFLKVFSLPNFFFHATLTYALLRHGGVELGKMDYLGAP
jgi:hypothetical protein